MMNFIPGPFLTYLYLLSFSISALFYEKFSGVFKNTFHWQSSKLYNFVPSLKLLRCSAIHTCHMRRLVSGQHIQAHFPFLFSISKSRFISSYSLNSIGAIVLVVVCFYTNFKITVYRSLVHSGLNNLV